MKGTGCLEDIFIDTTSVEYNREFNPYIAGAKVNTYHRDKQEDKMQDLQMKTVIAGTNMAESRQDHDIVYETSKTEIMKSSQKSRSVEMRTRSGCISCRPEGRDMLIKCNTCHLPLGQYSDSHTWVENVSKNAKITKIKELKHKVPEEQQLRKI